MHIAGITFVRTDPSGPFEITFIARDGNAVSLTWTDVGPPTDSHSATVSGGAPPAFFRVRGQ